MKKLPHSWKILDKIILNILSSDLHIHDDAIKIVLSCNFENIVKGRCNLIITEKKKKGRRSGGGFFRQTSNGGKSIL